jgi:hypothetical protein
MDIYAKRGHKVRYMGSSVEQVRWGGNDDPSEVLKEGEIYEVDHTEVHSYHTKVFLVGVEGRFNSASFEDAAP